MADKAVPLDAGAQQDQPLPGRCTAHGGLMWSNAMRACITPDDVIRGGCVWQDLDEPRIDTIPESPLTSQEAQLLLALVLHPPFVVKDPTLSALRRLERIAQDTSWDRPVGFSGDAA